MSFKSNGLNKINEIGSVGFGKGSVRNKYGYVTVDDAAAVEANGYFNSVADRLSVGDQIDASLDVDATASLKCYVVTSVTGGVVQIAAQTTA
ncbi:hypothetical protein SAMN05444141_102670 [Pseudovibrio denitrificans]|uniref:Uncharacterized protein n=1 Tax=Pseudovibrio denitrificans TaxID=258256 RepID=A0A1I6ZWV0_9HYPH|nr:hypothetical protein [Pseudovibrio denitrificans]SFT67144.1 hypothetical protein SAMN05444141_102670 [Pseudovibrio denitrificans]